MLVESQGECRGREVGHYLLKISCTSSCSEGMMFLGVERGPWEGLLDIDRIPDTMHSYSCPTVYKAVNNPRPGDTQGNGLDEMLRPSGDNPQALDK
ncbi:Efflux pump membrane transporter BepE [Dissostichus eleginoides]|uniref:Efflux pump membrane transporter BepE n=1 Tax=Dissostichus eleginoides TaxID=100907 RepID=A0AAD9BEX2_DISEL|nr:Efflux pump membrane transporter BepE [Dissostichus eleginoides]